MFDNFYKIHVEYLFSFYYTGVGKQIDERELRAIASKPSGRYVFMVDDFSELATIIHELAGKACKGM